jgi:HEAT repeat protein
MAASENVKTLVDQMPPPDERSMYTHIVVGEKKNEEGKKVYETKPIDAAAIDKATAELLKGGQDAIVGVIDLIKEHAEGGDVKPRYALHAMGLLAGRQGDAARKAFAGAIASQVGGNRPKDVQKYLVQELQYFGHADAVPALAKALADDDLCEDACRALVAIGDSAPLRGALGAAKGKCRLHVIQALGALKDKPSAAALKQALDDADEDMRLTAAWALASQGEASAADALIKMAAAAKAWPRIQLTKSCFLLAERCAAAGDKAAARKIYTTLKETRTGEDDKHVREAADLGLAAIG